MAKDSKYVGRAGDKLAFALREFQINPEGMACADFGCNIGGFTDCLLQHGATRVYAVDTGYGMLAWTLRQDDRVVVMERSNAMHVTLPETPPLICIDVGWTRQHKILPAAWQNLPPGGTILSLLKTHYEAEKNELRKGTLLEDLVDEVLERTLQRIHECIPDIEVQTKRSPLQGERGGNIEFLLRIDRPQ